MPGCPKRRGSADDSRPSRARNGGQSGCESPAICHSPATMTSQRRSAVIPLRPLLNHTASSTDSVVARVARYRMRNRRWPRTWLRHFRQPGRLRFGSAACMLPVVLTRGTADHSLLRITHERCVLCNTGSVVQDPSLGCSVVRDDADSRTALSASRRRLRANERRLLRGNEGDGPAGLFRGDVFCSCSVHAYRNLGHPLTGKWPF